MTFLEKTVRLGELHLLRKLSPAQQQEMEQLQAECDEEAGKRWPKVEVRQQATGSGKEDVAEQRQRKRLLTRAKWAAKALEQAGFVEWGFSETNGLSRYYIREGDVEDGWKEKVRIRVSDHYAHSERYDDAGNLSLDFGVEIDDVSARRYVEKQVREAIQERDEYLASDEYEEFCEEQDKAHGLE